MVVLCFEMGCSILHHKYLTPFWSDPFLHFQRIDVQTHVPNGPPPERVLDIMGPELGPWVSGYLHHGSGP